MSQQLERAQKTLEEKRPQVNPRYKPAWHLSVPAGWLNDPNGFGFYQGKLHLFYQYHPYDSVWGPMHWGHWTSGDLIHWQELPVAMAPDTPADEGGVFSGTAIEKDGKLYLVYTGVTAPDDTGKCLQQQCIAESDDGIHVRKWPCNPVIGKDHLPKGFCPYDFRDPKIQRTPDGFRIVAASKGPEGGQLISFRSPDMEKWTYSGVFVDHMGAMTECPDVFELDGRTVSIFSVIPKDEDRHPEFKPVVYLAGQEENGRLIAAGAPEPVDWGMDFYAPQTTCAPDGRRLIIGWALSWGHVMPTHTLGHGWAGMMSMIHELTFDENGKLCHKPLRELETLRKDERHISELTVHGECDLPAFAGDKQELLLDVDMRNAEAFTLHLLKTQEESFDIAYDKEKSILRADRSRCGYPATQDGRPEEHPTCEAPVPLVNGHLRLHLFIDVSIIEIFADEGRKVLTSLAFPKGTEAGVSVSAMGEARIESLTGWSLG